MKLLQRTWRTGYNHVSAAPWIKHGHWRVGYNHVSAAPWMIGQSSIGRRTVASSAPPGFPTQARVVICGGGVIGNSIAYHLADRGWTDVVLIEQGKLTCGTTWHSAGLIGALRDSASLSKLTLYSRDLYRKFEETGHSVGWKQCGSLVLARTKDRLIQLKRRHALAKSLGEEAEIITPSAIKEYAPIIKTDDLEGALYLPDEGVVTAPDVAMTFSSLAKQKGVRYFEGVSVNKILTERYKVTEVETSAGNIKCEYFVNCGGLWSREIGKKSQPNVKVPLHPCEHYYLITKPIPGVDNMMPVVRDPDGYIYTREWSGGILTGGFEPVAKPVFHQGIPEKFEFQLLPEDWDHFQILLEQMLHRIPALVDAEILQVTNGPESFTPDEHWILGEAPEIDNYFVAAGMHSLGIVAAGGVGKYMTEWIIDGEPSINLWSVDIRRFMSLHNNKKFLIDRVKETLGKSYSLKYPFTDYTTGRNLRASPLYTRLHNAGAFFGETIAYERPMWFNPNHDDLYVDNANFKGSFGKPSWYEAVKEEYWACKEGVCLIDMSSFAKYEVKSAGSEALEFLQYLCSNNVDQSIGTIVHTGMQNHLGGYENDCSVIQTDENSFFIIAPTSQQTRCLSWLRRNQPRNGLVQVRDLTSMYSGINLIGPHAQELLQEVTDIPTTKDFFKPMTCRIIDVGYASGIRAMRLTHAGEDGFVLYVPAEYALHVYDVLMKAGKDFGIRNAGYFAMRHLRIEKFFAYWGIDLDPRTTPLEAGRDFRVKFNKGDFIGREALLKQKEKGISKKFVQFLLEGHDIDSDLWPWGGESIYRNGKCVGYTSSAGYGFTLEQMICLGFVHNKDENENPVLLSNMNQFILDKNAKYEIDIAGKRFPAKAGIHTLKQALTSSSIESIFIPVPKVDSRKAAL